MDALTPADRNAVGFFQTADVLDRDAITSLDREADRLREMSDTLRGEARRLEAKYRRE